MSTKPPCVFTDCDRPSRYLKTGLCSSHYAQQLRGRELTPLGLNHTSNAPLRTSYNSRDYNKFITALQSRCHVIEDTGCWEWIDSRNRKGYSSVKINGKSHMVHRIVVEMRDGSIKPHEVIHHRCSNRCCVNPDHLQSTSQSDNVAEMLERRAYEKRIASLEAALRAVDPTHALLS